MSQQATHVNTTQNKTSFYFRVPSLTYPTINMNTNSLKKSNRFLQTTATLTVLAGARNTNKVFYGLVNQMWAVPEYFQGYLAA